MKTIAENFVDALWDAGHTMRQDDARQVDWEAARTAQRDVLQGITRSRMTFKDGSGIKIVGSDVYYYTPETKAWVHGSWIDRDYGDLV